MSLHKGNFDKPCYLSPEGLKDIAWWRNNIFSLRRSFQYIPFTATLTCDASNLGWGAIFDSVAINGRWSFDELSWHINALELQAIYLGLKSILTIKLRDSFLLIRSDNTTAVSYINKKGGLKSLLCLNISSNIWTLLEDYNCIAWATHIPGSHNVLADIYSRKFKDNIEWSLHNDLFAIITNKWGYPTIDLFASRLNHKCPIYAAWKPDPTASYIDAFSFTLDQELCYIFPPFSLIARVWSKIVQEKANAILICPDWPGQPWYAAIRRQAKDKIIFKKQNNNLCHPSPDLLQDPLNKIPLVAYRYYAEN